MMGRNISALWRRFKDERQSKSTKDKVAARLWLLETLSELLDVRLSISEREATVGARLIGG